MVADWRSAARHSEPPEEKTAEADDVARRTHLDSAAATLDGGAMDDPIARFQKWFARARSTGMPLPEAMALATADACGRPSVRFVLMKQIDERGLVFYTDTRSRKGSDLRENPYAACVFYWDPIQRQVRLEGKTEPVSEHEADLYWSTRPRPSQLAASISTQSAAIGAHPLLLERYRRVSAKLAGQPVPRPHYWSGFRIVPEKIEFWTRRAHRLHERELFVRTRRGWKRCWLQP